MRLSALFAILVLAFCTPALAAQADKPAPAKPAQAQSGKQAPAKAENATKAAPAKAEPKAALKEAPKEAPKEAVVSEDTQSCLSCHETLHPGLVASWRKSAHAKASPAMGLAKDKPARTVSADKVSDNLAGVAVGCAECHVLNPKSHADTFEHNGYEVHTVVTPHDCATCHPVEEQQYDKNIMAHAYNNLRANSLYMSLAHAVNGVPVRDGNATRILPSNNATDAESCLSCHGTDVKVIGSVTRETDFGGMEFPVLSGWPNQGVGRLNPDGSKGSCASCHSRHEFSLSQARKPYACKKCHDASDVPAYEVYSASTHGGIYQSEYTQWNFTNVPWVIGQDFTAPTCAACHVSLVVAPDGTEISPRTHTMTERLPWRLFGLVYAHPQPKSPDTSIIRAHDGLPYPVSLDNKPAQEFLIDKPEMEKRRTAMQATCRACHHSAWVDGHWERLENTITTTNAATLAATEYMQEIWARGWEQGPLQGGVFLDEHAEKLWGDLWLFFANDVRFASAMACGMDHGVFDAGRYQIMQRVEALRNYVEVKNGLEGKKGQE